MAERLGIGIRPPVARPLGAPSVATAVHASLSQRPKTLDPKYFYDQRGSELFDEITRLPEYYLTRAERGLLARWMPSAMARLRPATLVELGAGGADKTRLVLDAMRAAGSARTYVPVDVSATFLEESARRLRRRYPWLTVEPLVADITAPVALPDELPAPMLVAFLGSTIGNFDEPSAVRLLTGVRTWLHSGDRFLLGADLRKDPARIEAAYNDARGVTAAFNRNILHALNATLGSRFDPDAFEHRAFYDRRHHRIEMHLVARHAHQVTIPGAGTVHFDAGESVRTEISCKYDRATVEALLGAAGLRIDEWMTDDDAGYALLLAARADA